MLTPASAKLNLTFMEDADFGLSLRVRPERLYMAMKGFFDESGTHGADSPLVTVAGFLATVEQWAAYERDLSALMSEYGVKKFHAKDFRGRKNDFKGWPTSKRAKFNSRFLKMADDHLSCGISTILSSDAYHQIYRGTRFPPKARPDTHYGLCVRGALWKVIAYMKDRPEDWPLSLVMEGGHKNEYDAARIFYEFKDDLRPEYQAALGGIVFGSKDDLPIAIADSLAYSMFRMSAGYSAHPTEPNACVVGPADPPYYVSKIPMSRTLIDEETLVRWRDELCR